MTRAVVFDYGQTLVTFEYPRAELVRALDRIRDRLPPAAPGGEEIVDRVLRPLEALLDTPGAHEVDYEGAYAAAWAAAGVPLDAAQLELAMDEEQRVWDRAARLAPPALAVLSGLRERGFLIGIASNAPFPARFLHRQLDFVGIAPLVDCARFSSEVGWRKPDPRLYRSVLECLGVSPPDVLFVGDRVDLDYDVPRRLGMRALVSTELTGAQPSGGVSFVTRLEAVLDHV